ncbi:hypothetical protein IJD34_00035 [bacterium]|nr:hypothetical protein [bacterium]
MNVRRTLILLSFLFSMPNIGHAFDIDATVDDEIRKNYNPDKLIEDTGINDSALNKSLEADPPLILDPNLPKLPNISNQGNSTKVSDVKGNNTISAPIKTIPYTGGHIRVSKGTSFDVINTTAISDWQRTGTKVSFKTNKAIHKKKYSIPLGTTFYGEVVESHQPQLTGNGGLVVIKIYSMIYKNQTIPINAYITRANDNKIFFNNIKGDRTYWKTVWKKGNWGRTLFGNMVNLTASLGSDGPTLVLAPFPLAYGTICLGVNAITSPICAIFSKGGHVSIPSGKDFRIKLTEDISIN